MVKVETHGSLHWLTDVDSGFAAAIPLPVSDVRAVDAPLKEHVVDVQDRPIQVGLRVDFIERGLRPEALATSLAHAFATSRTAGQLNVVAADQEMVGKWGAEAAASALYLRPGGTLKRTPMEEIMVLVRGERVAYLTRRFDGQAVDSVTWGLFASAMNANLGWDRPRADTPWPKSEWLKGDVNPTFTDKAIARGKKVAETLKRPAQDAEFVTRLYSIARGIEDPKRTLDPATRKTQLLYLDLLEGADSDAFEADLKTCRTAHDLRGVALVWLHAARAAGFGLPD